MGPGIDGAIWAGRGRGGVLGLPVLLVLLLLGGCSSAPPRVVETPPPPPAPTAHPAVEAARSVVGTPYRNGGESPAHGFDCSGLVKYAYGRAGAKVPRSAAEQYRHLPGVPPWKLAPGDLVFFEPPETRGLHVGIYVGDDRFVHAPSTGKRVGYASLANPYWQACFIGGRRGPVVRGPL